MYAQDNNTLPVWIISSQAHHHISINSQPFLVGIVSHDFRCTRGFAPHRKGDLGSPQMLCNRFHQLGTWLKGLTIGRVVRISKVPSRRQQCIMISTGRLTIGRDLNRFQIVMLVQERCQKIQRLCQKTRKILQEEMFQFATILKGLEM